MRIILYCEVKGHFVCTMPRPDTEKIKIYLGLPHRHSTTNKANNNMEIFILYHYRYYTL